MGTTASPNTPPTTSTDAAGALSPEELVLQRRLKILVAGLGLLIVLGLLLVIGRVVYLASSRGPANPSTAAAGPSGAALPGDLTMALPAGAVVKSMTMDGSRLAVHFEAPSGTGISILDVGTGRTLSRVKLVPEPPRN